MRKHTLWRYETFNDLLHDLAPRYKGTSYGAGTLIVDRWETGRYSSIVRELRPKRAQLRLDSYFPYEEVERAKKVLARTASASIRLGVRKTGRGLWQHKEDSGRGDFCMVSAVVQRRNLSVHCRSVELSTGLAFDTVIIDELARVLGRRWLSVTFFAANVAVFARPGGRDEPLFHKIRAAFDASAS